MRRFSRRGSALDVSLKITIPDTDPRAEGIEAFLNGASAAVYTSANLSGIINAQLEARSACGA